LSQSRVKAAVAAAAAAVVPALGRLLLATLATHRGVHWHTMVGKEEEEGRQEDARAGVRLRTKKTLEGP